jgi:hypothetical protein
LTVRRINVILITIISIILRACFPKGKANSTGDL